MNRISQVEENDLHKISELYGFRKSTKELKWLYSDPYNKGDLNAYVARDENDHIVGIIGYESATYEQNDLEFTGVIFMTWLVAADYKGFAAVSLLKKVSNLGDFAISIAGSELGQSLYPILKYKKISKIDIYYKILNFNKFYKSLDGKAFIRKIGLSAILLPSYFRKSKIKTAENSVELVPYIGNNFILDKSKNGIFKKKVTKNYLDWLLECPLVESYAFVVKNGDKELGMCVVYIKTTNKIKKGRIVHLPFLGKDDKLWSNVIDRCVHFLRKKDCCLVTGLAHHKMTHEGFLNSGFILKQHNKPVYIKDPNENLKSISLKNWHIQFSEGDKGYRGF